MHPLLVRSANTRESYLPCVHRAVGEEERPRQPIEVVAATEQAGTGCLEGRLPMREVRTEAVQGGKRFQAANLRPCRRASGRHVSVRQIYGRFGSVLVLSSPTIRHGPGSLQGSGSPARLLDDLRLKLNAILNGGAEWASLYALPLDFNAEAHRYGPGYNQYLLTLDAYWFDYCLPEHDPFWIGAVKLPLLQLVFSERPLEEIATNGSHRKELGGCRIEKSGAIVIPSASTVIMELLGDNYVRRSAEIRGILRALSENQIQKIRLEITKHRDPYATVFHEAVLADAQIAGTEHSGPR